MSAFNLWFIILLHVGAHLGGSSTSTSIGGFLLPLTVPVSWNRVVRETVESDFSDALDTHNFKYRQKRSAQEVKSGELYLPVNYSSLEIPKTRGGKPLAVALYLNIRSIASLNEAEEEMTIEFDATVEWRDHGLLTEDVANGESENIVTTPKTLDPVFLKKIWKPDIFVENLIEANQPILVGKPVRLKYSPTGHIIFNARVKIRVDCKFYFRYYPADTQKCVLTFRSFAYNSTEFEFKWRRPNGVYLLYPEDDNYDIALGDVSRVRIRTFADGDRSSNETFDALQFTVMARRRLSYHLIQTYLPSQLFLGITWLCFMVPKNLVEGRIAIVMTTLLTLTSMFSSVRESTPIVSYTKAIDLWMVACIASVFLVLLECAALLWTETEKQLEEERSRLREEERVNNSTAARLARHMLSKEGTGANVKADESKDRSLRKLIRRCVLRTATGTIAFVEEHAFILGLSVYMLMNGLYWAWLLNNSGYFEWAVDATHNAPEDDGESSEEVLKDMYA